MFKNDTYPPPPITSNKKWASSRFAHKIWYFILDFIKLLDWIDFLIPTKLTRTIHTYPPCLTNIQILHTNEGDLNLKKKRFLATTRSTHQNHWKNVTLRIESKLSARYSCDHPWDKGWGERAGREVAWCGYKWFRNIISGDFMIRILTKVTFTSHDEYRGCANDCPLVKIIVIF